MATDRPTENDDARTYYLSAARAEAWRRGAASRAQVLTPLTERMLDLAGVTVGSRVLDVGAGTGEQTLMAAQRVGEHGSVLAIDISAPMLALAAEAAREAGFAHVQTQVMDARSLDVAPASFDAAISRSVLMLIPERQRALRAIHRALKPGGKFAVIVFSSAEKNPAGALARTAVRRHAGLPLLAVEDPGLFALGAPGVLQATYEQAGFRDVAVQAVQVERRIATVAEAVQRFRDSNPDMMTLLAELSEAERERALAAVGDVMRQFARGDAVIQPSEYLIGVGTR